MNFDDLIRSREILGIGEAATMTQIRARYRQLAREHHPDLHGGSDDDRIKLITNAYRVVCDYCNSYTYSFSREEFLRQDPDENLRQQFADVPLWGTR